MILRLALALACWLAPGAGRPVETHDEEPSKPERPLGRMPDWFGPGVAVDLGARHYDDPAEIPEGQLAAASVLATFHGRLAGYASRTGRRRAIVMLMPELMLGVELGGTTSWRDAIAVERGLRADHGVSFGTAGIASIGAAWATPGRVGVYGRVNVGQRFVARTHASLDGHYWIAAVGPSAGLRIDHRRMLTLLVGGGVEGSAGVQRFEARGAGIAQLTPILELGLYTQPRPDLYFGLVARGDLTIVGQRYGGRRLHGRAFAEVAWRVGSSRPSAASILLVYEGNRTDAPPGHPQFAAEGERRLRHQFLLAGGIAF